VKPRRLKESEILIRQNSLILINKNYKKVKPFTLLINKNSLIPGSHAKNIYFKSFCGADPGCTQDILYY